MEEKNTTIEDLAVIIKHGFDDVDRKFIELRKETHEGFQKVAEQFEKVDERFDTIDTKIGHIEDHLDHLDARMGRVEADIGEMRGELVYRHEFEDVLGRVKYLEKKMGIESGV